MICLVEKSVAEVCFSVLVWLVRNGYYSKVESIEVDTVSIDDDCFANYFSVSVFAGQNLYVVDTLSEADAELVADYLRGVILCK